MHSVGQGIVLPGNGTFSSGSNVNLFAINSVGWSFVGWTGDVTGFSNTTITLNANKDVTGTFAINAFTISVTPAPVHGSIVSANGTSVNYGNGLTFVVTADAGYHIVDVMVDGVSKGAVTSWDFTNVQASHTISAH